MKTVVAVFVILAHVSFAATGATYLRASENDITNNNTWDADKNTQDLQHAKSNNPGSISRRKLSKERSTKGYVPTGCDRESTRSISSSYQPKCIILNRSKPGQQCYKVKTNSCASTCRYDIKCINTTNEAPKKKEWKRCIKLPKCKMQGIRLRCERIEKCWERKYFETNEEELKYLDTGLVYDYIKNGNVEAVETIFHDFFETLITNVDDEEERSEMLADKWETLATLDIMKRYNYDKSEDEIFEDGFDEPEMNLDVAIDMIDSIPDKDTYENVHDNNSGDIEETEKMVHENYETFVTDMNDETTTKNAMANKKNLSPLDIAVEHYNDGKSEDEIVSMNGIVDTLQRIAENQKVIKEALESLGN